MTNVQNVFADMERDLLANISGLGDDFTIRRSFDGRLIGQGWETPFVPAPNGEISVEAVTFRSEIIFATEKVVYPRLPERTGGPLEPRGHCEIQHIYKEPVAAAIYERADLAAGDMLAGPAIIRERMSTTFVPAGHDLSVGAYGELIITKVP